MIGDPFKTITGIASSGLAARTQRMRIVAENIANARSTGTTPGADPYRRKTVEFTQEPDRALGASRVKVSPPAWTAAPFPWSSTPATPPPTPRAGEGAERRSPLAEMADLRRAGRSYQANLR